MDCSDIVSVDTVTRTTYLGCVHNVSLQGTECRCMCCSGWVHRRSKPERHILQEAGN
jgi:hypothetical protein